MHFLLDKHTTNVYKSLCAVSEPQQIVLDGIAKGEKGRLCGKGLYDWSKKDTDDYLRRKSCPYFDYFDWTLPK